MTNHSHLLTQHISQIVTTMGSCLPIPRHRFNKSSRFNVSAAFCKGCSDSEGAAAGFVQYKYEYLNFFYILIILTSALITLFVRLTAFLIVWIYQIHAIAGTNSSPLTTGDHLRKSFPQTINS